MLGGQVSDADDRKMKDGWDMLIPEDERTEDQPEPHVWKQKVNSKKSVSDLIPFPTAVIK
jgi:hypothetical protein